MTRERSARVPQARGRAGLWRLLSALGVGAVLAGCAPSTLRVVVDGRPQYASPATPAAPQVRAWHITQMRTEDGAAFRVVANEPPPTPKTLASGGAPISPTATAAPGPSASRVEGPARPPRATRHARVRTPVGTVHFAPGAARVHAGELPIVAVAAARAGRADRLVLTVHTDAQGSLAENRRLAALRAESVATALVARGVDPAQLIVLSRPRCCAVGPLPERDAAPDRRVDIEILTHRVPTSPEPDGGPEPRA